MNRPTELVANPEQRAFSPDEVATMLGIGRRTVFSLLKEGELGSKKIGGSRRVFLSDLEGYLGEERAHSLVREINGGEEGRSETGISETGEDEEDPKG